MDPLRSALVILLEQVRVEPGGWIKALVELLLLDTTTFQSQYTPSLSLTCFSPSPPHSLNLLPMPCTDLLGLGLFRSPLVCGCSMLGWSHGLTFDWTESLGSTVGSRHPWRFCSRNLCGNQNPWMLDSTDFVGPLTL